MYIFLDYFLVIFHSSLVFFVLFAWAWKKARRIHLIASGFVLLSWFGLGFFYGWGYCPCTDWHWEIKYKLGETNLPNSYIKYYADKLTDIAWNSLIIDTAVLILGFSAFVLSAWLNYRDINSNH